MSKNSFIGKKVLDSRVTWAVSSYKKIPTTFKQGLNLIQQRSFYY